MHSLKVLHSTFYSHNNVMIEVRLRPQMACRSWINATIPSSSLSLSRLRRQKQIKINGWANRHSRQPLFKRASMTRNTFKAPPGLGRSCITYCICKLAPHADFFFIKYCRLYKSTDVVNYIFQLYVLWWAVYSWVLASDVLIKRDNFSLCLDIQCHSQP